MLITKIEATEACHWLRAAGFPQYVQLFKDCRFPVDIEEAKGDHGFLDQDALDSLCRRLNTLNKCVETRPEPPRSKRQADLLDEDDFFAISPRWTYDRRTRRWRRLDSQAARSAHAGDPRDGPHTCPAFMAALDQETSRSSSGCSPSLDSSFSAPPSPESGGGVGLETDRPPRRKRTGLLRKMEKLRLTGSIAASVLAAVERPHPSSLQGRPCSPTSSSPSSPQTVSSNSSSSQSESSSAISTPRPLARVRGTCHRDKVTWNHLNHKGAEDLRNQLNSDNSNDLVFHVPRGHKPGTFPASLLHNHAPLALGHAHLRPVTGNHASVNCRTGSFRGCRPRGGRCPPAGPDQRLSVYDNVPDEVRGAEGAGPEGDQLFAGGDVFSALDDVLERINHLQRLVSTWTEELSSSCSSCSSSGSAPSPCHVHLEVQRPQEEDEDDEEEGCEKVLEARARPPRSGSSPRGPALDGLSASRFVQLQKHALLRLTALMDKYSPSSRQGWNWTVPKPPRKTKVPETKGRRVFGVPLLHVVQQTGECLPPSILRALVHLRTKCVHQVGLFRKSGVKSRIQVLRELVESDPEGATFDHQSAFDVADMVKQYFRDLPEPVFTAELCESFLHIYQYFPQDQQLVAAQAAILLLPDENREALRTLLFFLRDVVASVDENQMTPTNIAVCLAPSLFHLNNLKRDANAARSSRRKVSLGRPDQRDLSETLAATQGLASMITEAQRLFQLPEFWPGWCQSAAEDVLSEDQGHGGGEGTEEEQQEERTRRLLQTTQLLLKDFRDKNRGWESYPGPESVDLSFKKMDDGDPLCTWRGCVDLDVPQRDVFQRLLREQRLWDPNLRQAHVVQTLSRETEVYRYVLQSAGDVLDRRPPQEHLLLRTWQADPSSGPLYVSSVSTECPGVPLDGVRAEVQACLYVLEPTGTQGTRLTHICRTDSRGRTPAWHSRVGGNLLASGLLSVRDSFRTHCRETHI